MNFLVLAFLYHYSSIFYCLHYLIIFLKASMSMKFFYICIRFFLLNNDNLIVYCLEKKQQKRGKCKEKQMITGETE